MWPIVRNGLAEVALVVARRIVPLLLAALTGAALDAGLLEDRAGQAIRSSWLSITSPVTDPLRSVSERTGSWSSPSLRLAVPGFDD